MELIQHERGEVVSGTCSTFNACPYCSGNGAWIQHSGVCPKIKTIEYWPNGAVKRIEFHDRYSPEGRDNG